MPAHRFAGQTEKFAGMRRIRCYWCNWQYSLPARNALAVAAKLCGKLTEHVDSAHPEHSEKVNVHNLRRFVEGREMLPTLKECAEHFRCSMKRIEEVAEEGDFTINVAVRMGQGIGNLARRHHTVESLYETEGEQ
ncbi:MAG: hypothetical protein GY906_12845 [bacterium]|nr:hypothetical protein [bacterium]